MYWRSQYDAAKRERDNALRERDASRRDRIDAARRMVDKDAKIRELQRRCAEKDDENQSLFEQIRLKEEVFVSLERVHADLDSAHAAIAAKDEQIDRLEQAAINATPPDVKVLTDAIEAHDREFAELQKIHDNLGRERDAMRDGRDNLIRERDAMREGRDHMAAERDKLARRITAAQKVLEWGGAE